MHLDLSEEETVALLNLLSEAIENDRYPVIAARPDVASDCGQVKSGADPRALVAAPKVYAPTSSKDSDARVTSANARANEVHPSFFLM